MVQSSSSLLRACLTCFVTLGLTWNVRDIVTFLVNVEFLSLFT